MPPPLPSPGQPYPEPTETPTGEHEAATDMPAPPRATVAYVDSLAERFKKYVAVGVTLGGLGVGAAGVSHMSATAHADTAINERTAKLEERHDETRRRLDALEVKVDGLRDQQDSAEVSAKARQQELLDAIRKGGKR